MKYFDFRKFRQLIPIPVLTVLFVFQITAQCPEYTPDTYNNPGSCEEVWFLDDDYNVSFYDGCSAFIILDLTHSPAALTGIELDTMIVELYTYYDDTKTWLFDDPRVTYGNLATEFDGDKYKDFGFVQDPVFDERFYYYNTSTTLKLDSLLDLTPKHPLIDSNDLYIIEMTDLAFGDCVTIIYDIKYVTDGDVTCLYENKLEFVLPSEQICGSVENAFPPDDQDCSLTPDDTTISIESENGCEIADVSLTNGDFCFKAGEGDCINVYIEECGDSIKCITRDDIDTLIWYLGDPQNNIPSNPYFFVVADLDRDGDVDSADRGLFEELTDPSEGNYIADCVLIEDPGEETARVEQENVGLRFCDPYPLDDLDLIVMMMGDIDGDCGCNEDFYSGSLIPNNPTNHSYGNIKGVTIQRQNDKMNIKLSSESNVKEVRVLTFDGKIISRNNVTEKTSDIIFDTYLIENNSLFILQLIGENSLKNYVLPNF